MSDLDFSDRYGVRPARWKGVALALFLVGGGWLAWAGLHHARPDVSATLISFTIPSDNSVQIRYSITRRDPASKVICTLIAHDFDKNVVGQVDESIAAGAARIEKTTLIRTRSAAVSAGVSRCWTTSQ